MSIIKIVLRKKKDKDGKLPDLIPLAIRITKDRKSSYIFLGHSIRETDWDDKLQRVKKAHPNSARLYNYINKKIAEATDRAIEIETDKDFFSSNAVKNKIKPKAGSTFFAQAESYLTNLKLSGKYNQYTSR